VGRPEVPQDRIADHVLALTRTSTRDQVFTLHAELEGGAYLPLFLSLLRGWRAQGHVLGDLAAQRTAQRGPLAVHSIRMEEVPGRSGVLAVQGAQVLGTRQEGSDASRLVDHARKI
jgi:undecaprenyl phosphate-alpha-L-ara4FN deformylase